MNAQSYNVGFQRVVESLNLIKPTGRHIRLKTKIPRRF